MTNKKEIRIKYTSASEFSESRFLNLNREDIKFAKYSENELEGDRLYKADVDHTLAVKYKQYFNSLTKLLISRVLYRVHGEDLIRDLDPKFTELRKLVSRLSKYTKTVSDWQSKLENEKLRRLKESALQNVTNYIAGSIDHLVPGGTIPDGLGSYLGDSDSAKEEENAQSETNISISALDTFFRGKLLTLQFIPNAYNFSGQLYSILLPIFTEALRDHATCIIHRMTEATNRYGHVVNAIDEILYWTKPFNECARMDPSERDTYIEGLLRILTRVTTQFFDELIPRCVD